MKRNSPLLNAWQLLLSVACLTTMVLPHNFVSAQSQRTARAATSPLKEEQIRELFVPFKDLDLLLKENNRRVFMTRDEFEELKRTAASKPAPELPTPFVVLAANYDATLYDGRALMTGSVQFEILDEGLQEIPLQFSAVGIRDAQVDGEKAHLGRDQQGRITLFAEGAGRHELKVQLVMPVKTEAAQQTLAFQVPSAPAQTLKIHVSGNVEVKSGASIVQRNVDSEANQTHFQAILTSEPMSIVMSLNNKKLREQNTIMTKGVIVSAITEAYERLHATLSMDVVNGAADEFRFQLDDSLEVNSVQCPQLSKWEVESTDGLRQLVVQLRSPTTERTMLEVQLDRKATGLGAWQLPTFRPVDVSSYTAILGVLAEDRLRLNKFESTALIPVDSQVLSSAISPNALVGIPGAIRIQAIAAYYAPGSDFELRSQLALPEAEVHVRANTLYVISDAGLEASGGFAILPKHEKLFSFDFDIPLDWDISWIKDESDKAIHFERFEEENQTRVRVMLPEAITPGQPKNILFELHHLPSSWLEEWDTQSVVVPSIAIRDANSQEGAVAIQVIDDLVAAPSEANGLIVLNENEKEKYSLGGIPTDLAYRYSAPDWDAEFSLSRTAPRIVARVFSFFGIRPEALAVHQEAVYFIDQARAKTLVFSLPDDTPDEITIRGLDGVTIKETSSEIVGARRQWTVELADRHSGAVRLAVDFTQTLEEEEPQGMVLPAVRAEQVAYQSGALSVEGHPELDVQVAQAPRAVDIGELVDANYRVGKRLLGAFGYVGTNDLATVDVSRRPVAALPATIVERAELVTVLSNSGTAQSVARFQLFTKSEYLESRLPPDATLWSIVLDGEPAFPHRVGDKVLVALPSADSTGLRDLSIVYETPLQDVQWRGDFNVSAPELFERGEDGAVGAAIPTADLRWKLVLPDGYATSSHSTGDPSAGQRSFLNSIFATLWEFGGGRRQMSLGADMQVTSALAKSDSQRQSASVAPNELPDVNLPQPPAPAGFGGGMGGGGGYGGEALGLAREADGAIRNDANLPQAFQNAFEQAASPEQPAVPPQFAQQMDFIPPPTNQPQSQAGAQAQISGEMPRRFEDNRPGEPAQNLEWALQGVRSLQIALADQHTGQQVELTALGDRSDASITVFNRRRLNWVAFAAGLLVFLLGLSRRQWKSRFTYVLFCGFLAIAIPIGLGWTAELVAVQVIAFAALLSLLAYYLLTSLFASGKWRLSSWSSRFGNGRAMKQAAAIFLISIIGIPATVPAHAQEGETQNRGNGQPGHVIYSPEELASLLERLAGGKPVDVPDDAIVVPFDPDDPATVVGAEKLLVPYDTYIRLWKLANPDGDNEVPPPVDYAWDGASYSGTLDGSQSLVVDGVLSIRQFVDHELTIPLTLEGCVLESITVNDGPAKVQLLTPSEIHSQSPANNAPPQQANQQAEAAPRADSPSMLVLHTAGKGTKEIKLRLRWKLNKSGGWKIATGQLPSTPASALTLTATNVDTEIRLTGMLDRVNYSTTVANEKIETALGKDGRISLWWREKISAASIDQGMTVNSNAVFDVQEDALRLAWSGQLEFRRGRREAFTFELPADYLVERVVGDNVRGWTVKPTATGQLLDVELLKAATESEQLSLFISRQLVTSSEEPAAIEVPEITVPDAMLHQGNLTVRRSALLDIRVTESTGVSRVDLGGLGDWFTKYAQAGPIPVRPYLAYRFGQPGIDLQLSAQLVDQDVSVQEQAVMKISQMETSLETRLLVQSMGRPVHHLRIRLPKSIKLDDPVVPGNHQWTIDADSALVEDSEQLLEIYFADGKLEQFPIILQGVFLDDQGAVAADATNSNRNVDLPSLEVMGADRQTGAVVVQADPAYEVRTQNLQDCEIGVVSQVSSWLSAEQRDLTRTVIRYNQVGFSGSLAVEPRTPRVTTTTVSNIRVSDRAVEETILLQAQIESAGIRQYSFLLPASMQNARIQAPLLRQSDMTPVTSEDDSPWRVTLQLQDAIMGQFSVIVESDRLLSSGPQVVPLPTVETGTTAMRLITLENASRDELETDQMISVEQLDKAQRNQARFKSFIGNATMAYRVVADQAAVVPPALSFQSTSRETVETTGARIGLAQTLMVVDVLGTYQTTQEYRVENRTEPFLEVELPAGARLWTVQVAGEPVKPASVSNAPSRLRIPLIKTAEGDLDYGVVLKYGGRMAKPSSFGQTEFPLPKTVNINVELSQVRLHLPEEFEWFNFGGTLGRTQSEDDLQAGWLSFRTKQIAELTELMGKRGKMYSKMRAQSNLKQLESSIQLRNQVIDSSRSNENRELKKQLDANRAALQLAQQQVEDFQVQSAEESAPSGNRFLLNDLYGEQRNGRGYNVVDELGDNFAKPSVPEAAESEEMAQAYFNQEWFKSNNLSSPEEAQKRLSGVAAKEEGAALFGMPAKQRALDKAKAPELQRMLSESKGIDNNRKSVDRKAQQQMLGDYRQQVERYSERLEEENFSASGAQVAGAQAGGAQAGGRYANDNEANFRNSARSRAQQLGLPDVAATTAADDFAGMADNLSLSQDATTRAVAPYGGFAPLDGVANGQTLAILPQDSSGAQPQGQMQPQREGYLASLDVQLPTRGKEFLFTTTGGDLQISAQSVSADLISRFVSVLVISAVAIVLAICFRIFSWIVCYRIGRQIGAFALGAIGLISLVTGMLPIYGLLCLIAALCLLIAQTSIPTKTAQPKRALEA